MIGHGSGGGVDALSAAVTAEPGRADLWSELATALVAAGRAPEAWDAAVRAVELAPRSAAAHRAIGAVADALGDSVQARSAYRNASLLDPGSSAAVPAPDSEPASGGRHASDRATALAAWMAGQIAIPEPRSPADSHAPSPANGSRHAAPEGPPTTGRHSLPDPSTDRRRARATPEWPAELPRSTVGRRRAPEDPPASGGGDRRGRDIDPAWTATSEWPAELPRSTGGRRRAPEDPPASGAGGRRRGRDIEPARTATAEWPAEPPRSTVGRRRVPEDPPASGAGGRRGRDIDPAWTATAEWSAEPPRSSGGRRRAGEDRAAIAGWSGDGGVATAVWGGSTSADEAVGAAGGQRTAVGLPGWLGPVGPTPGPDGWASAASTGATQVADPVAWRRGLIAVVRIEWLVGVVCLLGLANARTAPYTAGLLAAALLVAGGYGRLRWKAATARRPPAADRVPTYAAVAAAATAVVIIPAAMAGALTPARVATVAAVTCATAAAVLLARTVGKDARR